MIYGGLIGEIFLITLTLSLISATMSGSIKAGLFNFSYDGIMSVGASLYLVLTTVLFPVFDTWTLVLVLLIMFGAAILIGLGHNVIVNIFYHSNPIAASISYNFFCYGLSFLIPLVVFDKTNLNPISALDVNKWTLFFTLIGIITIFQVLFKFSKFFFRVKAVGIDPALASFNHINVYKYRLFFDVLGCCFACFGGIFLVMINPILFTSRNMFNGLGTIIILVTLLTKQKLMYSSFIFFLFNFMYYILFLVESTASLDKNAYGLLFFVHMLPYLFLLVMAIFLRNKQPFPLSWGDKYVKIR